MKRVILLILLFLGGNLAAATWLSPYRPKTIEKKSRVSHKPWDAWLRKYVSASGFVQYSKGRAELSKIEKYTRSLQSVSPTALKGRSEKLAYYINLYNAMTVYGIYKLTNVNSVMSRKGFFDAKFYLGRRAISLNILENKIIRPTFREPLVHFALNCASYSCPPLLNRAYTARGLNGVLLRQAKKYMSNPQFVKLDRRNKILHLVVLFQWYKKDFKDVFSFYNRVMGTSVDFSGYRIQYIPYKWSLNGR